MKTAAIYNRRLLVSPVIQKQSGLTLVELMIALTIGLVLLAGISMIFVTSRSTYTMEEGLSRAQEGGRFSMEFLAQDIRMAGYTGCNSSASINNIANPATDAYKLLPGGLKGYFYTGTPPANALSDWTPALPSDFFSNGDVLAGTDVIVVQRGSALDTSLTGNMTADNANIQIDATAAIAGQIQTDDILMLSDCNNADIFRANNVSSGSGKITIAHSNSVNTDNKLSKAYQANAQLMKLVSRAYYIRPAASATDEPALMRVDLVRPSAVPPVDKQELVQGIENMRLLFGEDTNPPPAAGGSMIIYRTPDAVANWNNVNSVRIGLLLRTPTNVERYSDTTVYTGGTELVDGVTVAAANDNRRRQVYKSTILVRH